MFALSHPSARLSSEAKKTADLLFAKGEDYGYGLLFRMAFAFTPLVVQQNNKILEAKLRDVTSDLKKTVRMTGAPEAAQQDKFIFFGLHLRHSKTRDINGSDFGEIGCLERLMNFSNISFADPASPSCIVLVATDRQQTLTRIDESTRSLGCIAITSNHTNAHQAYGEHGPFYGEIAMTDIELLSRSGFFVGSSYTNFGNMLSTYSMVISGLIATQAEGLGRLPLSLLSRLERGGLDNRSRGESTANIFMANSTSSFPSSKNFRWLPTCGSAVGARYFPEAMYIEPKNFKCESVLLPQICPYWEGTILISIASTVSLQENK